MFDDADQWFKDHIGDIGDLAGIVSAVAGVLAFIPVLTPIMALIALGAGAIALAAHGTDMVVNEKWDDPNAWMSLGGDVIGLIPGVKAVGAGLNAAGDVVSGADRLIDVSRATGVAGMMDTAGEAATRGVSAFGRKLSTEIGEMGGPAEIYQWAADKALGTGAILDPTLATNFAKAIDGSVKITTQLPTAAGLFETTEDTTNMKNVSGGMGTVLGGVNAFVEGGLR